MRVYLLTLVLIFTIFHTIRPDEVYKSCSKIKKRYRTNHMSINSKELKITLYWGSDPARVAATIFRVLAKHALGYQKIELMKGSHSLHALKNEVTFTRNHVYNDVILALSTAWDGTDQSHWVPNEGMSISIAGPRLYEFGASMIPARQRLYVHVPNHFQAREHCRRIATSTGWNFYTDNTYNDCGFHNSSVSNQRIVYQMEENKTITEELTKRANSFSLCLEYQTINRTNLFQKLRTGNQSFFFVDYDIWEGDIDVRGVQMPPCIPEAEVACQEELDNVVALRVGDIYEIGEHAPLLLNLAYNFTVSPETIRTLLEHDNNATHIEDAACNWVLENEHIVDQWSVKTEYIILAFYCDDDHYRKDYDEVRSSFSNKSVEEFGVKIHIDQPETNCSDNYYIRDKINHYMKSAGSQSFIGAVVGNVNINTRSAKDLDNLKVPVLMYDAVDVDDNEWKSVWFTNGRSIHLALAMRDFFGNNTWNRIAVISDLTFTAKALVDSLTKVQKENGNNAFLFHNHPYSSPQDAKTVFQNLKDENARIILVNTNYEDAFDILSEAVRLEMNAADQYVWIVRDWRPSNKTLDMKHFMISFWSQSRDVPERNILESRWSDSAWPPYAVPLADAIYTLIQTVLQVFIEYPKGRFDPHSGEYIQQFEKTIVGSPVKGVTRNLTYKGHYVEEALVLLDEWRGDEHEPLTVWRVNATANSVDVQHLYRKTYFNTTAPKDGTLSCTFSSSQPAYHQNCYDKAAVSGLVLLLLMPPFILLAIRLVRRHIKRHENRIIFNLMVGRQQRAAQLSGYLIDRSQLEMRNELGAGRFGYVHLALWRRPGSPRQFVAAKSLRDLQDEREILREACTLASLTHPHIIRLVGICIDKEPPLMLMEVAFYGDLLHYLRSRRYLVDNIVTESAEDINQSNEEAFHVSAEALTKLARHAASALGYLSFRGVIHRDLRAANCLVDVNRSLKLADFGMAREIAAKTEDGDAEYACKRRGLFPVPWMAPESLEYGVFSAASDMWALGVLVFELVTLGAHPYGKMSPLRVIHYVTKGGKPSMPRGVTPQTSGLARLCWQSNPEQRPTAAEVVAYLADRPSALRPALLPNDMPIKVDSGYGTTSESGTLLPILLLSNAEMLDDYQKKLYLDPAVNLNEVCQLKQDC